MLDCPLRLGIVFNTRAYAGGLFLCGLRSLFWLGIVFNTYDGGGNYSYKNWNMGFFLYFCRANGKVMTDEEFFKKENPIKWVFEQYPELNAGQIAKAMGINESLFRNYINGSKRPSASRVMDIENFLQKLGKELSETRLL